MRRVGQGPTLVMIHGWGMHSGVFEPVVAALAQHFTLVLIDLPGCGQTPLAVVPDYSLASLVAWINSLVEEPAYWLGWSLGGLIATQMALSHPEKVWGLIQVATTPCFLEKPHWPGIAPAVMQQFYDNLMSDYAKTLQQFMMLQVFQCVDCKAQLAKIKIQLARCHAPSAQTLTLSFDLLRTVDLRAAMVRLTCPVLAILGRLDALVPVRVAPQLQMLIPQLNTLILSRASHMPFLSHPDEFSTAVIQHVL